MKHMSMLPGAAKGIFLVCPPRTGAGDAVARIVWPWLAEVTPAIARPCVSMGPESMATTRSSW